MRNFQTKKYLLEMDISGTTKLMDISFNSTLCFCTWTDISIMKVEDFATFGQPDERC